MSSDWREVTLEEVTTLLGDGLHGTPNYDDSGDYYFINGRNLSEGKIILDEKTKRANEEEYLKHKKDLNDRTILVSINGTLGNIAFYNNENVFLGKSACFFNVNEEVEKEFIYYVLKNDVFQNHIDREATGTTIKNVSLKTMRSFSFKLPPLETQEEIVSILGSIDQKIHLNQQTNETLEAMAQAIFKSWFVDFDPVRAKIEATSAGRDPNRAAMAVIAGVSLEQDWDEIEAALQQKLDRMTETQRAQLRQTAELFQDELVEREIGEVPKGWEVANYGKLIEYMIGGDWGKEEPTKKHTERVRIFRGTDLPDVFHGNDESVPVRFVQSKKLKTRKLKHGDIVFEVSGGSKNQSTGRNLLITEKLIKRFGSDLEPASFCKLMRPASIELSYYLGVHLRKAYDDDLMWQFQVQSTGISNFQTSTFMDQHYLVVPPNEILKQFQSIVEPIFDKIYNDENSELKKLRDTLLPKLISGEVGV